MAPVKPNPKKKKLGTAGDTSEEEMMVLSPKKKIMKNKSLQKKKHETGSSSEEESMKLSPRKKICQSSSVNQSGDDLIPFDVEPSKEFASSTICPSTSTADAANLSPLGSKKSLVKVSSKGSLVIPLNDDGCELTKEEVTVECENEEIQPPLESVGIPIPEEESIVQSMTFEQMQEHVTRCLQLSTENKINTKNAFGLRLIDCMTIISKNSTETSNFAAVACQLDAGAKIYSHRVDAVHQQVMKLADSCIVAEKRARKEQGNATEGEDEDSPDDEAGPSHRQPGEQRKKNKKKVLATPEQISKKPKENDPRDKYTRCEALPGGIFEKVQHDSKDLSLTLERNVPFWMDREKDYQPAIAQGFCERPSMFIKNRRLGPILRFEPKVDPSIIPRIEPMPSTSWQDVSYYEGEDPVVDSTDEVKDSEKAERKDNEIDLVTTAMSRMTEMGFHSVTRLDALKAVLHMPGESEYHYLRMDRSFYWSGPDFWKRPHGINPAANKKKVVRKKKEPAPIDFSYEVKERSLKGKKLLSGASSKRSTSLKNRVLSSWSKTKVTYPLDIEFQPQSISMLFSMERSSDEIIAIHAHQPVVDSEEGEDDENTLSNENEPEPKAAGLWDIDPTVEMDCLEFIPSSDESDDTDESEQTKGAEDILNETVPLDEEKAKAVVDPSPIAGKTSDCCDTYEGDNLVPMVKTIKVQPIKYVARPNRVDMHHLKDVMLNIIMQFMEDRENQLRSEGDSTPRARVSFRKLVIELFNTDELHYRTREDLTVQMTFLALLTLANEHRFLLNNVGSGYTEDIIISSYDHDEFLANLQKVQVLLPLFPEPVVIVANRDVGNNEPEDEDLYINRDF